MKERIKVAVMGYGTVGGGVCGVLTEKSSLLGLRSQGEGSVELKYVLDIRDLSDSPVARYWVKDIGAIVSDPDVDVVVETMGGVEPAFSFCMKCLSAGKSVVTSNKQLVAEKGEALFEQARRSNVSFRFGAAVCGGVPVLKTMVYGLAANSIRGFAGILNGTTNFILTKMFKENASFEDALSAAQRNGYAEADPAADIEGRDACRKTAILCSLAFGRHVYPDEIPTQGVTGVTDADAACAAAAGGSIKLIGWGKKTDGAVYAGVSPMLVPASHLLSHVDGVYNAAELHGDKIGSVLLYGQGAGRDATASAVAADVLDCIRRPGFDPAYSWAPSNGERVADGGVLPCRFYVRGTAADPEKAAAALSAALGTPRFLSRAGAPADELAFVTAQPAPKAHLLETLGSVTAFEALRIFPVFEG